MLQYFFLFIFLVVVLCLVFGVMAVWTVWHFVKGLLNVVKNKTHNANNGNSTSNGNSANNGNNDNDAGFDTRQHRTYQTPTGETIIDTRDPETANRKIIPHDEGEYVDYTE